MKYKIGDFVRDKLSGEQGIIHSISRTIDYKENDFCNYRLAYNVRFCSLKQYSDKMFESIIMSEEELV